MPALGNKEKWKAVIRENILSSFDESELYSLAFEFNISPGDLSGQTHTARVESFIYYMERHRRLPDLIDKLREKRPQHNWPDIPISPIAPNQSSHYQRGEKNLPRPFLLLGLAGVVIGAIIVAILFFFSYEKKQIEPSSKVTQIAEPAATNIATAEVQTNTVRELLPTYTPNPFFLINIPDPLGDDVRKFAASIDFGNEPYPAASESIMGLWTGYWRNTKNGKAGTGTALITNDNEWIYIIENDEDGGTYVIKAKLEDGILTGRYINTTLESDTHPFIGIVLSGNQIDGQWPNGEWNFTR